MKLIDLLKTVKKNRPNADISLIRKAYFFAEKNHNEQKRMSGDPFIQHPLNVANILAETKLDTETIVAALLHDVVEDSKITLEDLRKEFGDTIANLVDGVTKISKLKAKSKEEYEEYKAESIRKVILASAKDIRVIFIKLADKLHNMETVSYFRNEKRKRISREVMNVYAPIAHKLGIASIKWQLEDLAFKYLYNKEYEELLKKIKKKRPARQKEINKVKKILEEKLSKDGYKLTIFGRPKHIYSIYKKMKKKHLSFEEIYDLAALRIITKSVKECYEIIGIIHNLWKPIPNEFDDYIAMPKSNMYQSLHTAVIGPNGHPVEIQIRTVEMDKIAEEGIAAHWKYKGFETDEDFDNKLSWLKQITEWQQESQGYQEFMDMLKVDFFEDEIFTFSPQGRVIRLPKGATVIDFAYSIHSKLGDSCMGGEVNGKFVPVRTILSNGDQIKVITSKNQKPSRDWLKWVVTSKAKSKIKNYIKKTQKVPIKTIAKQQDFKKEFEEYIINVEGVGNPKIKLAKCCNPLPNDKILGFVTASNKVTVHKKGCYNLEKLNKGKKEKVKVNWLDNVEAEISVKIDANNRIGLFAEILNTIVRTETKIKSAGAKSTSEGMVECSFVIETKGLVHLQDLIKRIKKVKDVKKIYLESIIN